MQPAERFVAGTDRLTGYRNIKHYRRPTGTIYLTIRQEFGHYCLNGSAVILDGRVTGAAALIEVFNPASIYLDTTALANRIYLRPRAGSRVYISADSLDALALKDIILVKSLLRGGCEVIFVGGVYLKR